MSDLESYAINENGNTLRRSDLDDYGPTPAVIDVPGVVSSNPNFRLSLWTGKYLQMTLMSIKPGEDIGLEMHEADDQLIRIEQGYALVKMGITPDTLDMVVTVDDTNAVIIPAGTWHNIINTGYRSLKLFSVYAPPAHPRGTVHATKEDAMEAEAKKEERNS